MLCVGVALALFASTRNRRPLDTHRLEEFERRAEAGSGGTVGPNLDQAKPRFALVVQRVTAGKGACPRSRGS